MRYHDCVPMCLDAPASTTHNNITIQKIIERYEEFEEKSFISIAQIFYAINIASTIFSHWVQWKINTKMATLNFQNGGKLNNNTNKIQNL